MRLYQLMRDDNWRDSDRFWEQPFLSSDLEEAINFAGLSPEIAKNLPDEENRYEPNYETENPLTTNWTLVAYGYSKDGMTTEYYYLYEITLPEGFEIRRRSTA